MEGMGILSSNPNSFWHGRSVLVTGGAGFIGSWLSHDLLQWGARVVVLDLKETFPDLGDSVNEILGKATFVQGDVRDRGLLESLYSRHDIQTVFHLAAVAVVEEALKEPREALDVNVRGTREVLEAFRKVQGAKGQVIVASSDKAYGEHSLLPYREDFELLGKNPYDFSKSCADRIAQMYGSIYHLPICITRSANVYGGGDLHFSRLIPGAIKALFFEQPLEIRSDGLYQRDYVYIKDIVRAHLLLARASAEQNIKGEIFNFGTGQPFEVMKVVDRIAQVMQKTQVKSVILDNARHEIRNQYGDASKARNILDWVPQYSFDKGIQETVRWYQEYFQTHGKQES